MAIACQDKAQKITEVAGLKAAATLGIQRRGEKSGLIEKNHPCAAVRGIITSPQEGLVGPALNVRVRGHDIF
jgi:hypothetical protein